MFFVLSKLLAWLLTPLSWVLIFLLLSIMLKRKKWRKKCRIIGISLLLFFSNPAIANLVMKWWEVKPVEIAKLPSQADVAVVLTGITNALQEPDDRVHFNKGAERLMHAIQLYHVGKVRNILITGGSGSLLHQDVTESVGLAKTAIMCGVAPENIYIETESRNTHENALLSEPIIHSEWPNGSIVLITSAFHMRRSIGCFKKVGIQPIVFSTDLYSVPWQWDPGSLVVPSIGAMDLWRILIREWVGVISYKLAGYI